MIMSKAPKAGLSISMSHEQSLDELKKGDLDFLITAFKDEANHLERYSLVTSEYVVVTNKRLNTSNIDLKKYLASEHVAFQFSNVRQSIADFALERKGLKRKTVLWTANFHQAMSSVVHSHRDLMLTLPRKFAESSEFMNELTLLPVPFEIPTFELFLYWHKKSNTNPFLCWAKKHILNRP
jgi:DNA-binding transcriptional LysR family regulator